MRNRVRLRNIVSGNFGTMRAVPYASRMMVDKYAEQKMYEAHCAAKLSQFGTVTKMARQTKSIKSTTHMGVDGIT